jgi:hypothetical protein
MGDKFKLENYRWVFTQTRLEYLTQKIRHTLSLVKGEWFFNREIGVPYIPNEDLDKRLHGGIIEAGIQSEIMKIEGISKMFRFDSSMNPATRTLTIDFTVQLDTGETLSDTVPVEV